MAESQVADKRKRGASPSPAKGRNAKKAKTNDSSDIKRIYTRAGRSINRTIDAFCSIEQVILVGKASMLSASKAEKLLEDIPDDIRDYSKNIFDKIAILIPSLREYVDGHKLSELNATIIPWMNKGISGSRSDDAYRLKLAVPKYASADPNNPEKYLAISAESKDGRGFKHERLGRLLCPARDVARYDEDTARARQDILRGDIRVTGNRLPTFIYENEEYDPDDMMKGAFRGAYFINCYKDIMTTPSSVRDGDSDSSKGHKKDNAELAGMTSVNVESAAYMLMQGRFALTDEKHWVIKRGIFNYEELYLKALELFKIDEEWTKETLAYLNKQVFGDEKGRTSKLHAINTNDDDDDITMAKQQAAARRAAMVNMNTRAADAAQSEERLRSTVETATNENPVDGAQPFSPRTPSVGSQRHLAALSPLSNLNTTPIRSAPDSLPGTPTRRTLDATPRTAATPRNGAADTCAPQTPTPRPAAQPAGKPKRGTNQNKTNAAPTRSSRRLNNK
ncbi:hypothetical protein BV25DRAFT_1913815 [Artomyces pyxidatus]|uniref:Uncharacterized protein n=1 Tax=Artomyces pyxidatus TaxID=48021 RepID=A0ACB8TAX7_9AGAM|nr:hypothetical protein BV25DRAFT_1913815 [Artomyces pyxidatus]